MDQHQAVNKPAPFELQLDSLIGGGWVVVEQDQGIVTSFTLKEEQADWVTNTYVLRCMEKVRCLDIFVSSSSWMWTACVSGHGWHKFPLATGLGKR